MTRSSPDRGHRPLLAWPILGLTLTPLTGLGVAALFGLTGPHEFRTLLETGALPLYLLALGALAAWHFDRYLAPLQDWVARAGAGQSAPAALHRRMSRFPRAYWTLFLLHAVAMPIVYFGVLGRLDGTHAGAIGQFLLLQLTVAVLVGLPLYLKALDSLGGLVPRLGLPRVQVSLKSKLLLLGGFLPLLSYSLLMQFSWQRIGSLDLGLLALWGGLTLATFAVTWAAVRSMSHSLAPVEAVLGRSGASTHQDLAELRPQSTDEIGYLTQTLGRVFRRLGDQESQMRAVVDTAAEGIIVTDADGNIDTFNAAAEQLFGFLAAEIRGKPLAWLMPALVNDRGVPEPSGQEQETTGMHRNGQPLALSVRVSEMSISNHRMFTCLVADIGQRKQAEERLVSAEARYRDLVETAHDLVWSMDAEGRWTYLNRASHSIYGLAPEEMIGRHFSEFQAPDHRDQCQEAFRTILSGRDLVQYETVHLDRDGRPHHLSFNARAHVDDAGRVVHISGTARDITEQKAFQQQLAYQAEHDSLTGLFNRHYFQQELERTVARVARNSAQCALFYIDLDQFKYINDTLGHAAGDQLLVEISGLLASHVREGDLLARFGGDEFTLLVYNVSASQVARVGENFRRLFEDYRFHYDGKPFNVTCSIGGAMIDASVDSADEVLSHADLACNMAKTHGRNRVHLYNPADKDKAGMAEDMGWAARVREMLEHDRFQLVYQPIASVETGEVSDYEVLVRMLCDDGDVILPGGFMPAAERFGLIHSVDRWIVARAMHQLAGLREQGSAVRFSINLSGRAFEDAELLPMIQGLLRETGLDPAWLTFEITETAAIANLGAAERFIGELKDIGCQFALDDFGSGFSSFSYLKHLPVDKLKIDGSFVQGMAQASVDQAMVQSMNQVAHALGKVTIAEYVESEAILKLLREYGVDYAQGNFIGKPRDRLLSLAQPALASVHPLKA
ncbi:putative bifunctional diguanylate cyclase/phosphodiesterase [Thiohalobacter sp.]|uniref:putative bifunctional diguanylate cyclase/phosphodiesterase n=1 Tax=Thiohalobacter sp. TaxID=2025948 RepID=UPI00262C5FEA|nr:EAL domain-containing protein [Thiohalobacter sp.]